MKSTLAFLRVTAYNLKFPFFRLAWNDALLLHIYQPSPPRLIGREWRLIKHRSENFCARCPTVNLHTNLIKFSPSCHSRITPTPSLRSNCCFAFRSAVETFVRSTWRGGGAQFLQIHSHIVSACCRFYTRHPGSPNPPDYLEIGGTRRPRGVF